MANPLSLSGAGFDGSGAKFGSGALSGGYGVVPAGIISSTPWAVSLWFKLNSVPSAVQVMVGATQLAWIGFNANGTLHGEFGGKSSSGAAVSVNASSVPSTGVWHFATLSVSSTTLTLTLDGAVVGTSGISSTQGQYASGTDGSGHATGYFAIRSHGGYEAAGTFQFSAGEIDDVAFWTADKFNAAFTPPTAAYLGSEGNLVALYHLDGDGTDSAGSLPATVTLAPNSAGIVYSPGTWLVGSSVAKTINAGSSFRAIFTGQQVALTFDVTSNSTPMPQIYYRIDGVSWTAVTLAANLPMTMPATTAAWPRHSLEVLIKSTSAWLNYGSSQGGSRWSPQNAAISFTGIVLAAGQTLAAPTSLGQSVWIFGDSITEGYHTVSSAGSGAQDTDGSDALIGWAYRQRDLLGAEVGIIGFGGAAISSGGVLGVPSLPNSLGFLWSGQARSFSPAPDLIVVAYGENDGTSTGDATFVTNYKAAVTSLLSATPSTTKVACMIPFSQRKAADIATALQQLGSARVVRIDTSGLFNTADSVDGQHPLGVANIGMIGPAVANKLRPLLQGVRNRWTRS